MVHVVISPFLCVHWSVVVVNNIMSHLIGLRSLNVWNYTHVMTDVISQVYWNVIKQEKSKQVHSPQKMMLPLIITIVSLSQYISGSNLALTFDAANSACTAACSTLQWYQYYWYNLEQQHCTIGGITQYYQKRWSWYLRSERQIGWPYRFSLSYQGHHYH